MMKELQQRFWKSNSKYHRIRVAMYKHRIPDDYHDRTQVIIAENIDEIESLRPAWEYMQQNDRHTMPDADIDRYISVIEANGEGVQPHVMLITHDGKPAAMIISRIENHQLDLKLGYKTLLCPRLRCLTVVYGGILGEPEGALNALMLGQIMELMKSHVIDVIHFNHLRTNTPFYQAVRNMPGFLTRDYLPKIDKHWRMEVPERIDQFYAARSRKHRSNLRRAIRKFEKDYPDNHRIIEYTNESDVAEFIRVATSISAKTYQAALNVGTVNDERTHSLLTAAARQDWFRGHILFAGDVACAFQLGLYYREIYYLVNIGYDPDFNTYSLGTVLFLKVLESLCDDPSIHTIDFYFGDAWYKQSYGTEQWEEASPYIFTLSLYPVFVNVLRSFLVSMNAGLEYVLKKIGLKEFIKQYWRSFLQESNKN
jgi:hypothetical protein